jgi:hypothetical protein
LIEGGQALFEARSNYALALGHLANPQNLRRSHCVKRTSLSCSQAGSAIGFDAIKPVATAQDRLDVMRFAILFESK